ncbi:Retrovirus-related Pol polyprotein from transposon TNT 1-94 [Sesamum angolense]|uniref:Retrovirus-related Pol polyprotein from transposon TNT 1-94 n=1 Tax=Sesamum angolense TaxID=2727404 RepID=A0AAE1WAK1_9LAMI|nr:Retrovirus-related Pol polyprotein from transposon TNT 1-94 [Sesamum angolense]
MFWIYSLTRVLERSRNLNRDEVVLKLGDGKAVAAEAVGIVHLAVSDQVRKELKDYYYVPSMIKNIISIWLLDNVRFEFMINKSCFYLMKSGSSHLLGKLHNGLYILQQHDLIMIAQNKHKMDNQENTQIWYARLGHISQDRIRRLIDSKSLEIDDLDHLQACNSCLKGKITKKPFVGQSTLVNDLLDLIHSEVCGPLNTQARGGFSYFITFINDHSQYGYVYIMRFMGYPKKTVGYYFYDPSEQKVFVSPNAVFLEKGCPTDTRCEELLIEESSEATTQMDAVTSIAPIVPTNDIPILRMSTRVSQQSEGYGFLSLTGQLDNDPKTCGEAKSDINS